MGGSKLDINQGEKDKLYQWACDNYSKELEEKYFTKIDKACDSYFEKKSLQAEYCIEYHFQTVPELQGELDIMWKDDDIMRQIERVVLVAFMKNKPKMWEIDEVEDKGKKMEQLRPFIYNF